MLQTSVQVHPIESHHNSAELAANLDGGPPEPLVTSSLTSLGDKECSPQVHPSIVADHVKRVLVATPMKDVADKLPSFAASLPKLSYPKSLLSVAFLVSDSSDGTA